MSVPLAIIILLGVLLFGVIIGAILATFGWLVYALWVTH